MQDGQPVSCSSVCLKVSGRLILCLSLLVTITEILTWVTLLFFIVLDATAVLAVPRNFRNSLFTAICKNSAIGRYTSAVDRVCEDV